MADHTKFWYRNDLPNRGKEFVIVDAIGGTRQPAFDHEAVARAIGDEVSASRLPIDSLEYDAEGQLTTLIGDAKRYSWESATNTLVEITEENENVSATDQRQTGASANRQTSQTGVETSVRFLNRLSGPVEIFWISGTSTRQSYGKIEPGTVRDQHTFGGHRWEIVNDKGESLGEIVADDQSSEVMIDGRRYEPVDPPRRRNRDRGQVSRPSGLSPDGKWIAEMVNDNVTLKSTENDESMILSTDGREGFGYSQPIWSSDSQSLVAFRVESVDRQLVHLVRSSPQEGGRAELQSRPYMLPGDPFPTYELNLFLINRREQIKPEVDRFEHEWLRPRLRFSKDGKKFTYEQTDRGHGRFRLIEVDAEDGSARNIIDERSPTFIWTAHTETQSLSIVNWLDQTDEIIHATEKNGWRQLILIDAETGEEKRELTPRGIVVRGIERIDEDNRLVWFTASGRADQDPYFMHYGYVDLDSGKLTWITEGDGNHSIEYSPDARYVIDRYSRVDMGPVHELRRVEDGQLICSLEQADLSELNSSGWRAPEVFMAKGRDGQTDIWGIICRPRDFDPTRKYPVIEDIYAGPHGSFVPKSFSISNRYESLTSLGFIVVKIDGMGTANRSKAFHDVCWKNLKDGGFSDRIAWMRAAAEKHPELDLSRVGIYGTSAGGQNAAAAVLFHPEFYKAAVAACGCHDNRMDKASWNEQWMGYPVGPHYSECSNIDNAHRLQGKLMLIVGEMDTNVPPESTLRFADALIRADKDFDLLLIPNAGHGMGGAYGQRRMHEFFVRHLMGTDPSTGGATATNVRWEQPAGIVDHSQGVTAPPETFFRLTRERDRSAALSFYKKSLDIGGLPVVAAAEVADEALFRTREIVGHMLAGRHDILKAFIAQELKLVVLGKNESLSDLPELSSEVVREEIDLLSRYLKYSPGANLIVVGEENLLSDPATVGVGESHLVRVLAHAIHQIAGTRPEDPQMAFDHRVDWRLPRTAQAELGWRLRFVLTLSKPRSILCS